MEGNSSKVEQKEDGKCLEITLEYENGQESDLNNIQRETKYEMKEDDKSSGSAKIRKKK